MGEVKRGSTRTKPVQTSQESMALYKLILKIEKERSLNRETLWLDRAIPVGYLPVSYWLGRPLISSQTIQQR